MATQAEYDAMTDFQKQYATVNGVSIGGAAPSATATKAPFYQSSDPNAPGYTPIPAPGSQGPGGSTPRKRPVLTQDPPITPGGSPSQGSNEIDNMMRGLDTTPPTPQEESDIRAQVQKERQARIDAINALFDKQVGDARVEGQDRSGRGRAIAARSGILGSDFGNAQGDKIDKYNTQVIDSINAQRGQQIQSVLTDIENRADEMIKAQRDESIANRDKYLTFLKEKRTDARDNAKYLANTGVKIEELSDQEYSNLLDQTGMDPLIFQGYYNANLPKAKQVDIHYQTVGNKVLAFSTDPVTGQIKKEEFDTNIEPDEKFQVAQDGTPLIISTDKDGKIKVRVADGFQQGEFLKPTKATGGGKKKVVPPVDSNGNPVDFTPTEKRDIQGLGIQSYSPEFQRTLLTTLSNKDIADFKKDFEAVQQLEGRSFDGAEFLKEWLSAVKQNKPSSSSSNSDQEALDQFLNG